MAIRIIPRLDIKGPNLVKGIQLEGLRVLGRPEEFARLYAEQGADELLYMDIVASLYGRNSLLDMVDRTSRELFIPLTVGGGLRTLEDIRATLAAGADKVALNTAVINRPELISEAARRFGSSTIVVSIEAKRLADGKYEAFTDNGRERTGRDVFEWARQAAELGAGEIMITSIDREGTARGFDIALTQGVTQCVNVPVIACGGAGRIEHVTELVEQTETGGIALASLLHYNALRSGQIRGGIALANSRIASTSLNEIRRSLALRVSPAPSIESDDIQTPSDNAPMVAVIDCGTGNLAGVRWACERVGLDVEITNDPVRVCDADAVILPGVGAFGDAMAALERFDLVDALKAFAARGRPLMGVCLGMQLLFEKGSEFGSCRGLGLIDGEVLPLRPGGDRNSSRIPHIGWNAVQESQSWRGTLLERLSGDAAMYFLHSYYAAPADQRTILATTPFGGGSFCSVVRQNNVSGFQFHPERSGSAGLSVFRSLAKLLKSSQSTHIKSAVSVIR